MALMQRSRWLDGGVWLLAAATSSWYCWSAARQLGPTFDETTYLRVGMDCWRGHTYKPLLRLGTMPLPVVTHTLPIYLYECWHGTVFDLDESFDQLLLAMRTSALVYWWLLLAAVLLIGRSVGGPWAGRWACIVTACEPNLLAHAGLAATDIALAATCLWFACIYATRRRQHWLTNIAIPSLFYALTMLAKASGLVFGPLIMIGITAHDWLRSGTIAWPRSRRWFAETWRQIRPWVVDSSKIVACGLLWVFLSIGTEWQTEPTFVKWAESLPDGGMKSAMLWTSEHLRIFPNAGEGLVQQIKHNLRGHPTYLLGVKNRHSLWYYFPVVLSIKLSIVLLLAPAVLLMVQRRALTTWPAVVALLFLLFSLNCRVQIGLRMLFPMICLLIVAIAAAGVAAWQSTLGRRRRGWSMAGAALPVWLMMTSWQWWPNGLCYINEIWGASSAGYQLVSDSNFDWGQGVPELHRWCHQHGLDHLDVWYFGTDPNVRRAPLALRPFHDQMQPDGHVADLLRGHVIAASTTLVYGPYGKENVDRIAQYLRQQTPAAQTATFLIYDFQNATADRWKTSKTR